MMTTKIYCWINNPSPDFMGVLAMADDGVVLAQHISSHKAWAMHDIGITSDWKHDEYRKHCPDGYELEWVDNPETHEGVQAAYALNQAAREEAEASS